jgi:hypothetical protein
VAILGIIKQNLELINRDTHNLANQISINNNQGIDTSSKILIKSTNNIINEINKLVDKVNISGYNNNNLNNIFNFSSYTTTELGAINHIFACIFDCLDLNLLIILIALLFVKYFNFIVLNI